MARKDLPYLPLYVQDLLTDEKLVECSASAHGVYFRLMCILHKQETYGLLCLKQKYKQNESKTENFATMLVKQMPFSSKQIQEGLDELFENEVINITDFELSQKRMVHDGELSKSRAINGNLGGLSVTKQYGKRGFLYWIGDNDLKNKIGISVNITNRLYRLRSDLKLKKLRIMDYIEVSDMGKSEDIALQYFSERRNGEWIILGTKEMRNEFALLKAKLQAKTEANSDIDIEYIVLVFNCEFEEKEIIKFYAMIVKRMMDTWLNYKPDYEILKEEDYHSLLEIAYTIAERKGWEKKDILSIKQDNLIESWQKVVEWLTGEKQVEYYKTMPLDKVGTRKGFRDIQERMKTTPIVSAIKLKKMELERITPDQYFTDEL
jgi:hypothetical protein